MSSTATKSDNGEHLLALGEMVVAFQDLEAAITHAILFIVDPKWAERTPSLLPKIVEELPFKSRAKLLANFLHTTTVDDFVRVGSKFAETRAEEYPELLEKLKKGVSLAQQAEERRNQFMHSQWITTGLLAPSTGAFRMKRQTRANRDAHQTEHVTAASIRLVTASMREAARLIASAGWRLGGDAIFNALDKDDPLPS